MSGGSLSGIKVVALEQAVAMPYCSFILAEMGADVVKIERPGAGDCNHVQNCLCSNFEVSGGKRLHFGKQIQFDSFLFGLADRGEAVRAEAQVHAGFGK